MTAIEKALHQRAWRMLSDGQQHATQALAWAITLVRAHNPAEHEARTRLTHQARPFTLRELSLGANPW